METAVVVVRVQLRAAAVANQVRTAAAEAAGASTPPVVTVDLIAVDKKLKQTCEGGDLEPPFFMSLLAARGPSARDALSSAFC
jgi:hypothetical protein